jgi:hypothetical protein
MWLPESVGFGGDSINLNGSQHSLYFSFFFKRMIATEMNLEVGKNKHYM